MVKSGQQWSGLFVSLDATGALATPSVGPAGTLYVDGTSNGATVTISGSNPYKWTVTLPTLTAGQCVSMYITATIAGIATASVVAEDVADTKRVSDLNDAAAAPSAATIASQVRTELTTELAHIDTDISSRAAPGDEMDLVDAPNPTAVAALQAGLATSAEVDTVGDGLLSTVKAVIGTRGNLASVTTDVSGTHITSGTHQAGLPSDTRVLNSSYYRVGGSTSIDFYLAFEVPAGSEVRGVVARAVSPDTAATFYVSVDASTWVNLGSDGVKTPGDLEITTLLLTADQLLTTEDGNLYVRVVTGYYSSTRVDLYYLAVIVETAAAGGLTAQETADALLLAPSGAAAAGSAMDLLADILADTSAIDSTAITYVTSNETGVLTVINGATFNASLSGLTISATWATAWLYCKHKAEQAADKADIAIKVTNGGSVSDGLIYLNGAAVASPITKADGSLSLNQGAGTAAIMLTDEASTLLGKFSGGVWYLRVTDAAGATAQVAAGSYNVALV